jgi:hypothetical protein
MILGRLSACDKDDLRIGGKLVLDSVKHRDWMTLGTTPE